LDLPSFTDAPSPSGDSILINRGVSEASRRAFHWSGERAIHYPNSIIWRQAVKVILNARKKVLPSHVAVVANLCLWRQTASASRYPALDYVEQIGLKPLRENQHEEKGERLIRRKKGRDTL
jgi:hypothetical protein